MGIETLKISCLLSAGNPQLWMLFFFLPETTCSLHDSNGRSYSMSSCSTWARLS